METFCFARVGTKKTYIKIPELVNAEYGETSVALPFGQVFCLHFVRQRKSNEKATTTTKN